MSKQIINTGTSANSKNGDPIRTAFNKVNENFTELYNNYATRLVTSSIYNATTSDRYIGINYAGPVTVVLPSATDGLQLTIKDESGLCSLNPITIIGAIDNSTGATLKINNGALTLIYRAGWRII
jgi:hypothetical protein